MLPSRRARRASPRIDTFDGPVEEAFPPHVGDDAPRGRRRRLARRPDRPRRTTSPSRLARARRDRLLDEREAAATRAAATRSSTRRARRARSSTSCATASTSTRCTATRTRRASSSTRSAACGCARARRCSSTPTAQPHDRHFILIDEATQRDRRRRHDPRARRAGRGVELSRRTLAQLQRRLAAEQLDARGALGGARPRAARRSGSPACRPRASRRSRPRSSSGSSRRGRPAYLPRRRQPAPRPQRRPRLQRRRPRRERPPHRRRSRA